MFANMCKYSDYTRTMTGAGRRDALSFGDGRPATGRYI
jgi:hypothetical protein